MVSFICMRNIYVLLCLCWINFTRVWDVILASRWLSRLPHNISRRLCRDFGGPRTRTDFTGIYPCKPLEQKRISDISENAPICWRDTEIFRVVNELNLTNIIIADVAKPDSAFWDVHIGDRIKPKGSISDCTHNCLGLFNQDHMWWAIHNVAKHLSKAK